MYHETNNRCYVMPPLSVMETLFRNIIITRLRVTAS